MFCYLMQWHLDIFLRMTKMSVNLGGSTANTVSPNSSRCFVRTKYVCSPSKSFGLRTGDLCTCSIGLLSNRELWALRAYSCLFLALLLFLQSLLEKRTETVRLAFFNSWPKRRKCLLGFGWELMWWVVPEQGRRKSIVAQGFKGAVSEIGYIWNDGAR